MTVALELAKAFFFGGLICTVAQVLIDKTKLSPARILVLYVVAGVFLSAVGIYSRFEDIAGAGAATPLSGFGNLIAEGVREEVDKKGLIGALTGGLSASSGGICAAMIFALLSAVFFRSKKK